MLTLHSQISRKDAVKIFFEILDDHQAHIDRTKKKIEDIYAFQTPETPYFEYHVTEMNTSVLTPFAYEPSSWVSSEFEKRLDGALQRIVYSLELFPSNDYVPSIHPGIGTSDLIPSLYGCEFDFTSEGAVINKNYRITDLARDIEGFLDEEIDLMASPRIADQIEYAKSLSEVVDGRVQIVYPQMQGPLTNAVRIMEQTEVLMACLTDKPNMIRLCERITDHMIEFIKLMISSVPSLASLRPRARFYQPEGVLGLMVDDYISVVSPEDYYEICGRSWQKMSDEFGAIYMHTCGPVAQSVDMMKNLPGLAAFETAFVDGRRTTTANIVEAKAALNSEIVMGTFGMPHGEPLEDLENLNRVWLDSVSEGGGYMMFASGSYEDGVKLFEKLEI